MQRLSTRLGMDPAAIVAALMVLCAAPLVGMLVAGRASLLGVATVAVCVGLVLLMRPRWAVFLVIIGSIFNDYYINAGFALLGMGDLTVFALLPVWLLRRLIAIEHWRMPRRWPLLVGYLLLAMASLLAGVSPGLGLRPFLRQLTYVLALFAVVDIMRETYDIRTIFQILAVCGAAHAVYALLTYPGSGRLEGLPMQSNALGTLLAFCAIPTVGLILQTRRRWVRVALAGMLGLMLISMVLTISRGLYISFGLAMLWWMRGSRRMIIVALIAAAGLGWFLAQRSQTTERIQSRFEMRDVSVTNRLKVQQNAIKAVLERPLLGLGFAQFADIERAVDVNAEGGRGTHNHYLGTLASSGIPAGLLLFAFVFVQFVPLWRKRGAYRAFEASEQWLVNTLQSLAIYQGVSLAVRNALRQTEWFMLAIFCALLAIALSRLRDHQPSGTSNSGASGSSGSSGGASS